MPNADDVLLERLPIRPGGRFSNDRAVKASRRSGLSRLVPPSQQAGVLEPARLVRDRHEGVTILASSSVAMTLDQGSGPGRKNGHEEERVAGGQVCF